MINALYTLYTAYAASRNDNDDAETFPVEVETNKVVGDALKAMLTAMNVKVKKMLLTLVNHSLNKNKTILPPGSAPLQEEQTPKGIMPSPSLPSSLTTTLRVHQHGPTKEKQKKPRRSKWHRTHPPVGKGNDGSLDGTTMQNNKKQPSRKKKEDDDNGIAVYEAFQKKCPASSIISSINRVPVVPFEKTLLVRRNKLRFFLNCSDRSDPHFYGVLGDVVSGLKLNSDVEMIKEAMHSAPLIFQFASIDIRNHPVIALSAVKKDSKNMLYVSDTLKDSGLFVWCVIKLDDVSHAFILSAISKRLRDDRLVVSTAIKRDPYALRYASMRLKHDEEIVLQAVSAPKGGTALLGTLTFIRSETPTFPVSRKVIMTALENWDDTRIIPKRRYEEMVRYRMLSFIGFSINAEDADQWSVTLLCHVNEGLRDDPDVLEAILRVTRSKRYEFNYNLPKRLQDCPKTYALFLKHTSLKEAREFITQNRVEDQHNPGFFSDRPSHRPRNLVIKNRCKELIAKLQKTRYFLEVRKYQHLRNLTPHAFALYWKHDIVHTQWCWKQLCARHNVPEVVADKILTSKKNVPNGDYYGFAEEMKLLKEFELYADLFLEAQKLQVWGNNYTWWNVVAQTVFDSQNVFDQTFVYRLWY
jgi:hypothetical protein